jgi:uncharacterized protein
MTGQRAIDPSSARSASAFYVTALAVSWAIWAPWVMHVQGLRWFPSSPYLHLAGSLGPAVAALVVLAGKARAERIRTLVLDTFTRRAVKVTALWAVLAPTAAFGVSALALSLATGRPVRWSNLGVVPEYPSLGPIQYGLASLVCYGFGEEVGWRGFLYPLLRRRHRPLVASLLVVPFWAVWHIPLFLATDGYRSMGVGGASGWLVSLASGSLLTAWLYDRARSSVLPAAVLHAVLDIFFLADVGVPTQSALGAVVTLAGLAVVGDRLRRPTPSANMRSP